MRSGLRKRRFASWVALAALALQLVVSFGHVHLDGIGGTGHGPAVTGLSTHVSRLPASQPGHDGDDYCPICASIYLVSSSFVPQPPPLPVPFASHAIEHFDRVAVVFIVPRRTPFQSRAPPPA